MNGPGEIGDLGEAVWVPTARLIGGLDVGVLVLATLIAMDQRSLSTPMPASAA